MIVTPLRIVLVFAAVLVITAYALVIRPLEATIAARDADIDGARTLLERDLVFAGRLPALEAEHARLRARLGHAHVHDSRAAILDRFLQHVARTAAGDRVTVLTIAGVAPVVPPSGPHAADTALDEQPLDLTVRGAYTDVIRAVRDLNDGTLPIRIALAALGRTAARSGSQPPLNLSVHITLLREAEAPAIHAIRPS